MKKYILIIAIAIIFIPFSLLSEEDDCQEDFEFAYDIALTEYNSDLEHCSGHPMCVDEAVAYYNEAIIEALDDWRDCKGF